MFIYVMYKDAPELSSYQRQFSDEDLSVEKTLLINPKCPVRIMLEYIRKKCKLAEHTDFDLCDDSGKLLGLFGMATYSYAMHLFDKKRAYYVIVFRQEKDGLAILPQVNRDNKLYNDLHAKVKRFLPGWRG